MTTYIITGTTNGITTFIKYAPTLAYARACARKRICANRSYQISYPDTPYENVTITNDKGREIQVAV